MNIHHLELFYYVARHGGITEAVRNIPYGIQQPAVSGQVAQLEEYLGVVLFQRRPFTLTPSGEKLYNYICPFFSNLDGISAELQRGKARQIRIGASTVVLRDHLPELFKRVRAKFPNLKMTLREGYQAELEQLLLKEEIDLAVTLIEEKSPAGIHSLPMIKLPIALLVEVESPIKDLKSLWSQGRILTPLICLPEVEAICRQFQRGVGAARGGLVSEHRNQFHRPCANLRGKRARHRTDRSGSRSIPEQKCSCHSPTRKGVWFSQCGSHVAGENLSPVAGLR